MKAKVLAAVRRREPRGGRVRRFAVLFMALSSILAVTANSAFASADIEEFAESASPFGIMTPGVYSPSEGVPGAPAGTCAAEPEQPECPAVSKIVVTTPAEGEEAAEYGPPVGALTPELGAQAVAPYVNICGVNGRAPNVSLGGLAHTRAENHCYYGYGVLYTELMSALEKQQLNGNIQWRGSTTTKHYGAGASSVDHYAACNGRTEFNWLGYAYAYTVINGTAYSQSNGHWRRIPCN